MCQRLPTTMIHSPIFGFTKPMCNARGVLDQIIDYQVRQFLRKTGDHGRIMEGSALYAWQCLAMLSNAPCSSAFTTFPIFKSSTRSFWCKLRIDCKRCEKLQHAQHATACNNCNQFNHSDFRFFLALCKSSASFGPCWTRLRKGLADEYGKTLRQSIYFCKSEKVRNSDVFLYILLTVSLVISTRLQISKDLESVQSTWKREHYLCVSVPLFLH